MTFHDPPIECTCRPWNAVIPPPPCPIHSTPDKFDAWKKRQSTTTATPVFTKDMLRRAAGQEPCHIDQAPFCGWGDLLPEPSVDPDDRPTPAEIDAMDYHSAVQDAEYRAATEWEPAVDPDAPDDLLLSHAIADLRDLRERVERIEDDRAQIGGMLADINILWAETIKHRHAIGTLNATGRAHLDPMPERNDLAAAHDQLVDLVRDLWAGLPESEQRRWYECAENAGDYPDACLLLRLVTDDTP